MIATAVLATMLLGVKHPYQFSAQFVEGCSCKDICVTEITGRDAGCHGLGGIHFLTGKYNGSDISGTAASFAWDSGKWVSLVIDAPSAKRAAVTNLMLAFLADWGKMQPISNGSVKIKSEPKAFQLLVDGGKTGALQVKPVFGADGRTAVMHSNLTSPMHSSLFQGESTTGSFAGANSFGLKDTNGFYNMHCVMKGRI